MKNILAVFFVILFLSGCYYDNLEELHPGAAVCDTTGVISFSADILPIMIHSCGAQDMACHNTDQSAGGYGLGTYTDVMNTITTSGTFLTSITHDPSIASSKWMPKNAAKIDDCSIQKIEAWLNRGSLNN